MEQFLSSLSGGVVVLADPYVWLLLLIGTMLGVIVGALPGIGATVAYGLVLPFTYFMGPVPAVAFLLSIAVGNQFGNSIPAILIGLPGSPATILTVADGFALHKRARPGWRSASPIWRRLAGRPSASCSSSRWSCRLPGSPMSSSRPSFSASMCSAWCRSSA